MSKFHFRHLHGMKIPRSMDENGISSYIFKGVLRIARKNFTKIRHTYRLALVSDFMRAIKYT